MELGAQIQDLQNEVHCMKNSRDLKDAESVRNGPSHVLNQPALLPPCRDPGGIAKPQQSAARYLDFTKYIGKRFCKSTSVFL